jgi:hypothetical protein
MELDNDRIDEAVLALLFLGCHDGVRAWKSFDWAAMSRLHAKGLISDPSEGRNRSSSLKTGCAGPKSYSGSCSNARCDGVRHRPGRNAVSYSFAIFADPILTLAALTGRADPTTGLP